MKNQYNHNGSSKTPSTHIDSFASWQCSWRPSSNACATWNSLTPTRRSWSFIWWSSKGVNALLQCLIPLKIKTILDKHILHASFKFATQICSNLFGNQGGNRNKKMLRNWLAMANCPIFPFNFTKDLGKVRGALGPRAQRRVCEFLKHSISPQCSSTYNVILYPRSFRIFQIYSSDKMDWFMYVYLLIFTYAYSFLLLFLLRDSKSRADLQFN